MQTILTLAERESTTLFPTYDRLPLEISHGDGCFLYDSGGRQYLDLFGGLAVNLLGYCHPRVMLAISNQIKKFNHLSNLFLQRTQIELAEHLVSVGGYPRVFLTNSGTETTEGSIKLARKWGAARGKSTFIAFDGAFHGRSMGALSLMSTDKYREGYGPFLEPCLHLPYNDPESLTAAVDDRTCAVFLEFILGEGGVVPASREFIGRLFELRDRYGFLVVADEIQSGMGRTGAFCAFEHWGGRPDVVLLSKGLGGGLPLGAILASEELSAVFGSGGHGTTFGGNPVACAAGIATLDVITNDQLMENAAESGNYLIRLMEELQRSFPDLIRQVRGKGCMIGVELTEPCKGIVRKCLERGLLINCTQQVVLRFLPPLNVSREQLTMAADILRVVLESAETEKIRR